MISAYVSATTPNSLDEENVRKQAFAGVWAVRAKTKTTLGGKARHVYAPSPEPRGPESEEGELVDPSRRLGSPPAWAGCGGCTASADLGTRG